MHRVVLCSVLPDSNRGGTALTAAGIETVRLAFPDSQITLVTVSDSHRDLGIPYRHTRASYPDLELVPTAIPNVPGNLNGVRAAALALVRLWHPSHYTATLAMKRVMEADLVCCRGGHHSFTDRRGFRSALSMLLTIFPLMLAQRLGIPTVVLPSTIGPLRRWAPRMLSRMALGRTNRVFVRDRPSLAEARGLGVTEDRLVLVPDSVFAMRGPSPEVCAATAQKWGLGTETFAAVTIRGVGSRPEVEAFVKGMAEVVRLLLAQGTVRKVGVVVQDTHDATVSRSLLSGLDGMPVTLVDGDLSPQELMALYGSARVTIACRLHSAIFSLIAGTPALVFSMTGFKAQGVFEMLGLERFVFARRGFDPRAVLAAAESLVAGGEIGREDVRRTVARLRGMTTVVVDSLRQLANSNGETQP